MDLDRNLISAILRDGKIAFLKVKERLDKTYLQGDGKKLYEYLLQFWNKYKDIPSEEAIERDTGLALVDLLQVKEPMQYYLDSIVNRQTIEYLKKNSADLIHALTNEDSQNAMVLLEDLHKKAKKINTVNSTLESMGSVMKDAYQWYERIASGERGILTPWESFNKVTLGLWEEDFCLFVARPGKMKCVEENTLIVDPETGIPHKIRDIVESDKFNKITTWSKEKGIHVTDISHKVNTGVKECLEFTLRSGKKIIVTPEHPLLTPTGWVRADKLTYSDVIATPSHVPCPINPIDLSYNEIDDMVRGMNQVTLPDSVFRMSRGHLERFLCGILDKFSTVRIGKLNVFFDVESEEIAFKLQHLLLRCGQYCEVRKDGWDMLHRVYIEDYKRPLVSKFRRHSEYNLDESGVYLESIIDIKNVGQKRIYDLTIESTHCFVANDIIVHNTWFLQSMCEHAWQKQGKRVLAISTEMSKLRTAIRHGAINLRLPYFQLTHGELTTEQRELFKRMAYDEQYWKGFNVIGGDFDFMLESVEALIEETEPELLAIDGVALCKAYGIKPNMRENERVSEVMNEVKRLLKRCKIPGICTMHLNRDSTKSQKEGDMPGLEHISFSDGAGRNADIVVAMHQPPDFAVDNKMMLIFLKVREGKKPEPIITRADLDLMDFSEIPAGMLLPKNINKADRFQKEQQYNPEPYGNEDEDVPF